MPKYSAYSDTMVSGLERVVLLGPGCMAQIAPGAGLNMYSWIVDGRELMMPTQDVGIGGAGYGTPILFPTPNRVRDCTYTFEGKTHTLAKHGKPRFIHGLAVDEPFAYRCWADEQGAYCEGSMQVAPGDGMYEGYPYANRFTVRYTFSTDGVVMDFTVENQGEGNMPFGLAIHPYFTKTGDQDSVFLSCPATHRYPMDEQLLPTGELLPVAGDPVYDIAQPVALSRCDVDTVFSGMDSGKSSRVEFRGWGKAITLNADDDFGKVVVFTPRNRPGFCIEPQTCSTDAINLYSRGLVKESGLLILPAGQTWKGQARMEIEDI